MVFLHSDTCFEIKPKTMTTSSHHGDGGAWSCDSADDYAPRAYTAGKRRQHFMRSLSTLHDGKTTAGASMVDRSGPTENMFQERGDGAEEKETAKVMDESDDEIIDLLGVQLEEEMIAIEEEEGTYHQETSVRVVFMGAATENDKRACVQKLSQALLIRSRHKFVPSNRFKERKIQIVRGLKIDEHAEAECSVATGTFEDIGLSIIEADFSWSTGRRKQPVRYACRLFQYHDDKQALSSQGDRKDGAFALYPTTQIDLCIYFYEDSHHPDVVEEDLTYLCQLQVMGVPILPILVGDTTGNSVFTRRAQLAKMLVSHGIRYKSFDVVQGFGTSPSFSISTRHKVKNSHARTEKRMATVRRMRPRPCNIITISQFCVLNGFIISDNILREHGAVPTERPSEYLTSSPLIASSSTADSGACRPILTFWLTMMTLLFAMGILCSGKYLLAHEREPASVHVSLTRTADGCSFVNIAICDDTMECTQHHIPLPFCTQNDIMALGTLYIGTNSSRVELVNHGLATMCRTKSTRTPSAEEEFHSTKLYPQKEKEYEPWVGYYQRAIFILKNRSRILDAMFTKALT